MKVFYIFLLSIYSLAFGISPLFAQDSSPSATPSTASNSAIQSKLDDLKKEIASKAADLKAEIDKKIGNKAYVGSITGTSIDTLTVQAKTDTRSVKVDEYTVFQDQSNPKSKKALTLETLKNDDHIIALGEVDEKLIMTAKKVIKTDAPKETAFHYVFGQITKLELKKLTLKTKSGIDQIIGFETSTIIKNGKEAGIADDLKQTRNIIAVLSSKEASSSGFLYILPSGGIKPSSEATRSASPSASSKTKK